ncbi:MAG: hypothetical protein Q7K43_02135 [Candidatus Woesearchaeota archaeon]|nr:hypothetical protein [Candidatus Woesearchaeota archaeon]
MVIVVYDPGFEKAVRKINDARVKEQIKKQIAKILQTPEIGKPMRFGRSGTSEVYVASFRLSYEHLKNKLTFLELYHKDKQ